MRNAVVCITCIVLGCLNAVWGLPENWEWQNPLPTANDLYDVAMADANLGWAVGAYGTLLRTSDGGNTWQLQSDTLHYHYESVCFVSAQEGWIGGYEDFSDNRSLVLYTTDGGLTWIRQTLPVNDRIDKVQFLDAENGFATVCDPYGNGLLLQTQNGGTDWTIRGNRRALLCTHFLNNNLGWAISWRTYPDSSYIWRTTDGGLTWSRCFAIRMAYLRALCSVSATEGWAVGEQGIILHTTDGGESWQYQLHDSSSAIMGVVFADPQHGFALGQSGSNGPTSYVTTNGGVTWTVHLTGISQRVRSMALSGATHLVAVGESGAILRSEGGVSWMEVSRHQLSRFTRSVSFTDSLNGWIGGEGFPGASTYGVVWRTTDGGVNWNEQNTGIGAWISAVDFVDPVNGWAVGFDRTLIHSTNGGELWSEQPAGQGVFDFDFVNPQIGMGVSYQTVWRTTDGGGTWSQDSNAAWGELAEIKMLSSDEAWIIGTRYSPNYQNDTGIVAHTEDGGATWDTQRFPCRRFYSIGFLDADHGCIAGYACDGEYPLLYTLNGGISWNAPVAWPAADVYKVAYTGQLEAWAIANSGTILHTTDGGANWEWESFITNAGFVDITFGDSRHGWILGEQGALLHYSASPSFVSHEPAVPIPHKLALSAYPNPFNPRTAIVFDLPVSGHTTLTIYDVTGRMVKRLVDGMLPRGSQTLFFDGSRSASGVYFARLNTGEVSRVQKLMLLK